MHSDTTRSLFDQGARLGALIACVAALFGCAAQNAIRDGNELLRQGKTREGLAKLEEAARAEPRSPEYRLAYLQARERETHALIVRADQLGAQGEAGAAEKLYRQALEIQPGSERAAAGLKGVDNRRRWDQLMATAGAAVERKDWPAARAALHRILAEQPQHAAAARLAQRVEDMTVKPAPEAALAAVYRKPISIEFKDAPLKTLLEVIARTSGLNFIFDKDVKTDQKTSIYLRNSTIEAALNLTLLTNQLERRALDANTVLIFPNTPAKLKEYQVLTVKSFYLSSADAKTVANTLKTLLKARDVVVDEKLNLLIMRDSPEAVRLAERLVALHDVPDPEVMLEVEILEIKRTRLLELGVRWPEKLTLTPIGSGADGSLTLRDLRDVDSATTSASIGPLTVNARKMDSDANILANPRIRVRNREKAKVLIGDRVPNITTTSTSTGFVAESVTYVDVGLKLDVEPTISLDDEVAIKITLEVSNIINQVQTKSGSLAYQIGTRTAATVLRLKDGENQVLAGLINDEDRRTGNKVPALGELPWVGRLFGSQNDDSTKTEIVLSITPRIVRNVQRPAAALLEFESGTESSLRSQSADTRSATASDPSDRLGAAASPAARQERTPPVPGGPAPSNSDASPSAPSPSGGVIDSGLEPTPSPAQVTLQGPSQARSGDTFAVQIAVQSDRPIVSLPLSVDFDPSAVQIVSVAEGDFMRQGAAQTTFASRIDPAGRVTVTAARTGSPASPGATGTGTIATLTLRAVSAAATQSSIRIGNLTALSVAGQRIETALPPPLVTTIGP